MATPHLGKRGLCAQKGLNTSSAKCCIAHIAGRFGEEPTVGNGS